MKITCLLQRTPSPLCPVCLRLLVRWATAVERWADEVLREAKTRRA